MLFKTAFLFPAFFRAWKKGPEYVLALYTSYSSQTL
jgi:hypothetical protein